jgi:threonine dehydrogenase-like Zn-dependent dehydrogenase
MRAITLDPGTPDSAALEEVPEPGTPEGAILVDGLALGICGTDAEMVRGDYGEPPPGSDRLILGHESLGRVAEAPDGSGLAPGDLVARPRHRRAEARSGRALGATYHATSVTDIEPAPDVIVEATGVSSVVIDAMCHTAANGVVCLTGISSGGHDINLDAGALNRTIVLENDLVFGSVNANRRHYEAAADALARADRGWLERLITRRVPLDRWRDALTRADDDIKVVVELGA